MRNKFFVYIFSIVVSLAVISAAFAETSDEKNNTAYLAIIIDDFGYDGTGTEEMLKLDIPFTAAIMPFSNHTADDCKLIAESGNDAIIHMPMESKNGKKSWVGTKGIFCDMTNEEIAEVVNEAFDAVDIAVGINNHMGSAIMADQQKLGAAMDVVAEKGVIFIDSLTTGCSKGKALAEEKGIDYLERTTAFIDCPGNTDATVCKIINAAKCAKKKGYAVAIGHVGPAGGKTTAEALKKAKAEVEKMGVQFVTISELNRIVNEGNDI
ncbi:MAG: divergent polysaccharide deacetylase family protein [Candidatus Metalachnospira sp.]|nr:divergent polysaccharide deacetylase family protein [Candidatus Metalachnospira sp.]